MDFYYHPMSPPSRAIILVAKHLKIELNYKKIDILAGEHLKPEFLAINPQHTIPTLVDGNIKLWESRAICTYLASQYGKDDSLYPNNPKARCIVDARLYFDMGTLYKRFADYAYPTLRGAPASSENLEKLHEALGWFNSVLADFTFAAGNKVTVADMSLIASIATMEACGIDLFKYSRIVKWMGRCKSAMTGYEEANGEYARAFGEFLKGKIEELMGAQS